MGCGELDSLQTTHTKEIGTNLEMENALRNEKSKLGRPS